MTTHPPAAADDAYSTPADGPRGQWPLFRWFISAATLNVPQAAGPVAFALLALGVTGDTSGGAVLILAMTLAQVVGAIPITRLGRNHSPTSFLRLLVVIRTLALGAVALLAFHEVPFGWLVACATVAGSVNGAAFGYLRTLLNQLAPASGLPRALGISATLNEMTFVIAPVAASGLGTISPVLGVLVIAVLGATPAFFAPHVDAIAVERVEHSTGSVVSPAILLWLTCATSGGAVVAAVEIGAVALALEHGYEPTMAILFTVPLCLASVAGGIWVSVRNRRPSKSTVVAQLSAMALGSALAAFGPSVATTIVGAILIGLVLAPLGTNYSLVLDTLSPPGRQPEVFALLRTANAVGVIVASAILAVFSVSSALITVTGLMVTATLMVFSCRRAGTFIAVPR